MCFVHRNCEGAIGRSKYLATKERSFRKGAATARSPLAICEAEGTIPIAPQRANYGGRSKIHWVWQTADCLHASRKLGVLAQKTTLDHMAVGSMSLEPNSRDQLVCGDTKRCEEADLPIDAGACRDHFKPLIMKNEQSFLESSGLLYEINPLSRRSQSFKDPFIC